MIKYIVFSLLFLLKVGFLFGQNTDSLFHVITQKHENAAYYTIIKDSVYSNEKENKCIYNYEFVHCKHKDRVFAFLILFEYRFGLSYSTRYYASKSQNDEQFTIIDKEEYYSWYNIELLDLNNDNIREIAIYYEVNYPCNNREVYNFSTDSITPAILKYPYDSGILVCVDSTKNLYLSIQRMNGHGVWASELFVINKDFLKGEVLAKANWDDAFSFDIHVKTNEQIPFMTYFSSNSKSVINNFHPYAYNWDSKENIEFMKNTYLKMIEEFDIEY